MGVKFTKEITEDVTVITFSGEKEFYDHDLINEVIVNNIKEADEKKIVVNFSNIEGKRSIIEWIDRADVISNELKACKVAHVESDQHLRSAVNAETVFINRGVKFRAFNNRKDAIKWIKS
jgi:precorrin-6B methylase 2